MRRFRSRELQIYNLDSTFLRSNWRETKDNDLRVAWLPTMKIDAKAPDFLPENIMLGIDEAEKLFRFTARKERRIKKLGYPIHLMSVGQIKRHLHIFIGIFHYDDAVVIDVGALEFALEKDRATFCTSVTCR